MKLKQKLVISFLIIMIIPIILIAAVGAVIVKYQVNVIQESYDVNSGTLQIVMNPLQILNRATRGVFNDIKLCALKMPKKLEEEEYIRKLDEELQDKYSYIILRRGEEYLYIGDKEDFKNIKKSLPKFGDYTSSEDGGLYMGGNYPYFLKQQDFYFQDGSEGTVFVITDVNTFIPQLKTTIIQLLTSFVWVIGLTAVILTIWIYRSIVKPLNILHLATNELKQGNLDYSVAAITNDEIGMLCQDFEEMRIQLKELIEMRLQYEKDTKELISNISHDLKTPITAIKGYSEGLLDGVAGTREKQDKYIKTIYTKANDMTYLVDELSFYSRIDCNTIPYTFQKVNVEEFFGDCISEITLDLEVKNIELGYFNYIDKSVVIVADVEQLKRVVNNIIGNAIKYMNKRKGIINIRIQETGDFVQVEIEDNGRGIAEKDIKNIFDRFYRTDASRNSSQGGTGLGLSIVKKIVEDHGGKVWATSMEGVGTCIYFSLKKYKEKQVVTDMVIGEKESVRI